MNRWFHSPAVLFTLLVAGLAVTGCATTAPQVAQRLEIPDSELLADEIREADASIETEAHSQVPIEINDQVRRWIDYFSVQDRERFETFLTRGAYYRDTIQAILRENGVPEEMYFLAMIESGFVTHARSRAAAVGVWQFIRGTGRLYGLSQSRYLDERRDVIRATASAARYLRDLHDEFGSWYLAMAGYNAGEGRIRSAIRRGGSHDFWALTQQRLLPRETTNYVPKFLAAWIIGRKPERFGFEIRQENRFPRVEKVAIPGSVHLEEVARVAQTDPKLVSELNPNLLWGVTPPEKKSYPVWLPEGASKKLTAPGIRLARYQNPSALLPKRALASYRTKARRHHVVRRGETLQSIARKYRLNLVSLKRLNGLQSDRIQKGQALRLLPNRS